MRARAAAALAFLALLSAPSCSGPDDQVPDPELARLVQRARPVWANYGEDLKAQLGATPVARWSGKPVAAQIDGNRCSLSFEIDDPWRNYPFGIPVLVRDPLGKVHRSKSYAGGTYEFTLDGFAPGAVIPWIEFRFPPYEERRIAFDAAGSWREPQDN